MTPLRQYCNADIIRAGAVRSQCCPAFIGNSPLSAAPVMGWLFL